MMEQQSPGSITTAAQRTGAYIHRSRRYQYVGIEPQLFCQIREDGESVLPGGEHRRVLIAVLFHTAEGKSLMGILTGNLIKQNEDWSVASVVILPVSL